MRYQFGEIADTGIPSDGTGGEGTEGILDSRNVVLLREIATFVMEGDGHPMLAIQIHGRINKSEDTVSAVYMTSWMDAGVLVGEIMKAAQRGGSESYNAMTEGLDISIGGLNYEHVQDMWQQDRNDVPEGDGRV